MSFRKLIFIGSKNNYITFKKIRIYLCTLLLFFMLRFIINLSIPRWYNEGIKIIFARKLSDKYCLTEWITKKVNPKYPIWKGLFK